MSDRKPPDAEPGSEDSRGPSAPTGWQLWRAKEAGEDLPETIEFALFSDAHWRGELAEGLGPLRLLNTIGGPPTHGSHYGRCFVKLALQLDVPSEAQIPPVAKKTDPGSYHGGWVDEEIAALVSLALNVRCKSGGLWRRFRGAEDLGSPYTGSFEEPSLVAPKGPGWTMLPNLNLDGDLRDLPKYICRYAELDAEAATGLVRAARFFQQAVWIADAEPNISWVLLVSALESATNAWGAKSSQPPIEQIEENWQELGQLLREVAAHDQLLASKLAKQLRSNVKVQARVKQFISDHYPPAPEPRPAFDGFDWSSNSVVAAMGPIYQWRSRFLHTAIPFPEAMCGPPRADSDGAGYSERPGGLAISTGDATWMAEDTPMVLWPFVYLVGEALRAWWLQG